MKAVEILPIANSSTFPTGFHAQNSVPFLHFHLIKVLFNFLNCHLSQLCELIPYDKSLYVYEQPYYMIGFERLEKYYLHYWELTV